MATHISQSAADTAGLGAQWAQEAQRGWVIGLNGDLGAGKTELVKGLARGLGVKERVLSPTFGLVHQYSSGRLPLVHIDLYRLESREQIIAAGLEEYFYSSPGVTVIEWIERWWTAGGSWRKEHATPGWRYRQVTIEILNEDQRRISYEDVGP